MAAARRRFTYGPDKYNEKMFRPYVRAIGQSALAWSSLHDFLGTLFEFLITDGSGIDFQKEHQARAAWSALRSDLAQRQMLQSVIEAATAEQQRRHPKLISDVRWIINKIDSLSVTRNEIIHSPLLLISKTNNWMLAASGGEDYITQSLKVRQKGRPIIQGRELLTRLRSCYQLTLMYRNYVMRLIWAVGPAQRPWPKRPPLQVPPERKNRSRKLRQDGT
jgi:hypothetical protein